MATKPASSLQHDQRVTFPIVGMGASAGGLEALELFFRNVPVDSGFAFVIVQHLDPTHKGMMAELLQRATKMRVAQVEDRTQVLPNCVYLIPPNADLSLLHGVLHLLEPSAPRGLRLPIDFFFRSLAADQRDRSIGVILSGMGTDGTLGLKAIKEQAGLILVQEPKTAKFDGMPRSAVETGLADIVAAVEELPARLIKLVRQPSVLSSPQGAELSGAQGQLEKIIILLRNQTHHDFSLYKQNTLFRRIERRMGLHQIATLPNYVRFMQENSQEVELLFRELLIGVTSFFRDPEAWDELRDEALPALLASRTSVPALRGWVAGCSTGEEAYSLAIVFKEAVEKLSPSAKFTLQIFATDLDQHAVDKARQGFYPANIAADVSAERLRRYFVEDSLGYRVAKDIREMVIFAPQNLIMDPPFTKLDLLTCRNLLIYLSAELQRKLLPLFHYSLRSNGVLFLGSAESIGQCGEMFDPIAGKSRLFRRQDVVPTEALIQFPAVFVSPNTGPMTEPPTSKTSPDNMQSLAEHWLMKNHAPAAVLVNDQGDILFISGKTGRFLEPAAGKANWNLFVMADEGLRYELTGAFKRAKQTREAVSVQRIKVGDGQYFADFSVEFLHEPLPLAGLAMIVFHAVPAPATNRGRKRSGTANDDDRLQTMERELNQAREQVQSTREEMQSSHEELKSMNEELQSTNEELQSTNEELTTSKEEMQSLNEELQTVNAELQSKLDELTGASNDMKNLLNSTEIATIFLDNTLKVRRFTEKATSVIKLIPGDVGRPVTDLASELIYPELAEVAQQVLKSLTTFEKVVATRDGRWLAMRLLPYRTADDRIDGVVITFTDLSLARKWEAELTKGKT